MESTNGASLEYLGSYADKLSRGWDNNSSTDVEQMRLEFDTTQVSCKPLLKWPGGKRSELPFIVPRIPQHNRYFEPFFGGGSVYFDAIFSPAHVNDLHTDLMLFYRCVQEQEESFFDFLYYQIGVWEEATLYGRDNLYYEVRSRYNANNCPTEHRAADFFLLRELAYGGMFRVNSNGEFNVPFGRAYGRNKDLRSKVDNLKSPDVRAKMSLLELHSYDFADFLDRFDFNSSDFMFVDPPYDTSFSKYHQMDFNEADQVRLAEYLSRFEGRFMLVCKLTPAIEELYLDCDRYYVSQYEFQYKFNIKGRFSRSSTHVLITNYDPNI